MSAMDKLKIAKYSPLCVFEVSNYILAQVMSAGTQYGADAAAVGSKA